MIVGQPGETCLQILHLTESFSCRLSACESLISAFTERGFGAVVAVAAAERAAFETMITAAGFKSADCHLMTVPVADGGSLTEVLSSALADQNRGNPGRRGSSRPVIAFVDLTPQLVSMASAAEALELVGATGEIARKMNALLVSTASASAIPRGVGLDFCSVHDHWVPDTASIPELLAGECAPATLTALAFDAPQARLSWLHRSRGGQTGKVPGIEDSYRRGFLVLDRELDIRFASDQLVNLLGRPAEELVDRPLSSCLDGVDLATVRRETARVERGGESSPFITSWRIAPGKYAPREVTVDTVSSENQAVAYLLSVGVSETVRGPRTVYRDAREELSLADFVDDEAAGIPDEVINALESTQITRREHEVLLLILQGKANKEIARYLSIAEVTVKKHLTSVYRKLRINNRKELLQSFSVPRSGDGEQG